MSTPKRKNKPGGGRKSEGRVPVIIYLLPEARDALDARKQGRGDTRGKIVERMLGVAEPVDHSAIISQIRELVAAGPVPPPNNALQRTEAGGVAGSEFQP